MRQVHGGFSPFSYKSQPGSPLAEDSFINGEVIPAIDVSASGCFITGEEWLPGEFIIIPLLPLVGPWRFSHEQYIPSLSSPPKVYTLMELPELDPILTMMLIQTQ